jgi:integrase
MVIALKGVMREAWRMDLMPPGIFERMEFKLQRVDTDPTGRVLSLEEIHTLIAFARSSDPVAGDRNAALVAICYAAGLRRAEAARLMVSDYDLNTGTLRVLGKGKRVRLCYVTSELRECVHRWARKRMDGPLFPRFFATPSSSSNKRRVSDKPLHPSALNHLFADLQKGSGVKPFTPHDLRRSFATTLLENGADVITVQRLMGHASVTTTTVYDRRGEKAKKDAVELLTKPKWVPEKS